MRGLLRNQQSIKGTNEDRQESTVSWKLTAEHFRRRVCLVSVKAAKVQKILPGIIYPPKLMVRVSLVISAKTAVVLFWGLMPNHRKLKCNER